MTSKSVAREVPLLVPSLIAVGGIMGGSFRIGISGTLVSLDTINAMLFGAMLALVFLAFVPLAFPLPSTMFGEEREGRIT